MKRAKDRWLIQHLTVGVCILSCLVLPSVSAVRATALFRTTTTTTTTSQPPPELDENAEGAEGGDLSSPPPTNYTGIPQIDYIHDPNLPRELNGYNLSSYPFFETVPPPEEMDFKCDGLHDGFYASVAHKCQVYHHCLYGIRYDFLCANYTAFDQKTFICHFVSEVDCVNSPKYFHRNDALYIATTTSTAAPLTTTTTTTAAPPPNKNRGGGKRRPINRRPRPQYYYDDDYYTSGRDDDYYEEDRAYSDARSRRRKRPRPRRPLYDDYDDERYSRRPSRNRGEDGDDYDDRYYERPRKPNRRPTEDRRPDNRKQYDDDEDSRPYDRPRKPSRPSDDRRNYDRPRRPFRDEDSKYDKNRDDNLKSAEKNVKDERPYRDERPMKERPFKNERPRNDDRRNRDEKNHSDRDDRPQNKKTNDNIEPTAGSLVKPNGGSIYSKPRVPPKIARPVPNSEKDKYKYVSISSTQPPKVDDEEEYYYYEIEETKPAPQPSSSSSHKSRDEQDNERFKPKDRNRSNFDRDAPKRPLSDASGKQGSRKPEVKDNRKTETNDEYVYEDEVEETEPKKQLTNTRDRDTKYSSRKKPAKVEEEYYYEDEKPSSSTSRPNNRPSKQKYNDNYERGDLSYKTNESSTETSDKETNKNSYVRVIKRPFLPSRGGSPYLPRGLKPLGGKNFNKTISTTTTTTIPSTTIKTTTTTTTTTEKPSPADYIYEYEVIDEKNPVDESPLANYSDEIYTDEVKKPKLKDTYLKAEEKLKNDDQINKYNSNPNNENKFNRAKPQYEHVNNDNIKNSQETQKVLEEKSKEKEPIFRPSPQFTYPQKTTVKPYTPKIPEDISIKQNLADSIENEYDVTINDALSPTLPNLTPIRGLPSPFSPTDRDYTYSRFRNNNNYQENNSQQLYNSFPYRNQQINSFKYSGSQRVAPSYVKKIQPDAAGAASDPVLVGVSVRTPQSFYIQQPRYSSPYLTDDTSTGLRTSHLLHRHVNTRDFYHA